MRRRRGRRGRPDRSRTRRARPRACGRRARRRARRSTRRRRVRGRPGRRACGRARADHPRRPGPCRPAAAPAHGCATRPGPARRGAGRGGRGRLGVVAGLTAPIVAQPAAATAPDRVRRRRPAAQARRSPTALRGPARRVARSVASVSRICRSMPGGVEAQDAAQVGDRAVVDEPVAGDADDPDRHVAVARIGQPGLLEQLEDGRRRTRRSRRSPRASRRAACRGPGRGSAARSSGLANRALMTPTDQPSAASASAASIARA